MGNLDNHSSEKLVSVLTKQLATLFSYDGKIEDKYLERALERTRKCFSMSKNKYYGGENFSISPYHSGQYSIFLWYLSNSVWNIGKDIELASIIYYLNKLLNSVDWYYEIQLPEIFGVEHPMGSVLGRAKYGNNLFIYQGTSIGGISKGSEILYPKIGEYVTLCANSTILGDCYIGNYVVLGAGATIKNQDIPDNSIVFGCSPNIIVKHRTKERMQELFLDKWYL